MERQGRGKRTQGVRERAAKGQGGEIAGRWGGGAINQSKRGVQTRGREAGNGDGQRKRGLMNLDFRFNYFD